MSSVRSFAVVAVVVVAALGTFVALRRSGSLSRGEHAAPGASLAAAPGASASANAAPPAWPENAVTYDCSAFAPASANVPAAPSSDPASLLVQKARWYGGSAVLCGGGLLVTRAQDTELERAIANATPRPLPALARALVQNAAIKVARCARAAGAGDAAPSDAQLTALRMHAKALARRLAPAPGDVAALDATPVPSFVEWLGGDAGAAPSDAAPGTTFHANATGYTMTTRLLPTLRGADAFYGKLVIVDARGDAHALNVPAELVLRKTTEHGLTVCIAELALATGHDAPLLASAPLTVADLGPVGCDRCHQRGRRLAQVSPAGAAADADRAELDDVSRWYRAAQP